jgi:nucleotide-binding universal stress UspA family protein
MYKHILVPTDGSKLSLKAAREAAALAKSMKAKITALYVIAPYMPPVMGDGYIPRSTGAVMQRFKDASEKIAGKALDQVAAAAAGAKVRCDRLFVTNDQPWAGIIKAARDKKCDVIVMASHGRGGLAGLLLGSETHKVLTHSKKPVLVCR